MGDLEIDLDAVRDAVIPYEPLLSVSIDLTSTEFSVDDIYTLCSSCSLTLRLSLLLESTDPENYYTINTDSYPTFDVVCDGLDDSDIVLYPSDGIVPLRMLERDTDNRNYVVLNGLGSGQTEVVRQCYINYAFADGISESLGFFLQLPAHQDDE